MIKIKRFFSVILPIAILLATLAGCHGSRGLDEFVIPDEFDMSRDYEITFWAKNDTNKAQTRVYEQAIQDFEKIYPNITVNIRLYTDYSRIYNDVITNISTNTTPNVCITYPDHIATYLTGVNTVVPLDKLFIDEKYGFAGREVRFDSVAYDEIIPEYLNECEFNGHYYAIPYMRSTEACYINRTYVEKLGYTLPDTLTWDFVWEVSEAAMAKDDDGCFAVNGQKVMIPFIYKSTDNMMIQMVKQLDSGYSNSDGEVFLFNEETSEILNEIAVHARSGAFSTFKISSYPANFLNAGQCIFAVDSTAGATWMGTHAPLSDISEDQLVEFETAVMTIPQFDADSPKMISQGPSICVFNKDDPQEVLASWLFAQFMLTNDVQIGYAETEGYIPVTSKAHNSDEYIDYMSRAGEDNNLHYDIKIQASKLLLENVDKTFVTPVFNGSASLRDASGQLIENVVKSVRRKETIDEKYITKLYADVTALYRLDQMGRTSSIGVQTGAEPLPALSKWLLISLAAVWTLMGVYVCIGRLKKNRSEGKK